MTGLNPDCLHSLDVEQITASFLQAFARQRERLQQELRRHRQLVRRRQERQRRVRVQQLELVQVLRQERVREQALLLFCHKR